MFRDCMGTKGQVYALGGPIAQMGEPLDDVWFIGRTDSNRAATIGYEPYAIVDVADPNDVRNDDPAWLAAFTGESDGGGDATVDAIDPVTGSAVPLASQLSGGCFGAMEALLYEDPGRFNGLDDYVANTLDGGRIDIAAQNDPRLVPYFGAWSACIKAAGHGGYRSPIDALRHFVNAPFEGTSRPVSSEEIATAVSDVSCKTSTGLIQVAREIHDAYSRVAAAKAPDIAREHRAFIDRALDHAAAFDAGTLRGPWRSAPSPNALRNTGGCAWLPDDIAHLVMSAGDRVELSTYLDALSPLEPADELSPVDVPPWIIGYATCVADPAADDLVRLREAVAVDEPGSG